MDIKLGYRCFNSTGSGVTCELTVLRDDQDPNATDKGNNPDIKRQSVEFLCAATNQKIISLPQAALDKFINVVTLNLINVNLNNISYRHFKNLIQLKYLDLSCNKLRKLPRKLFKENENLSDVTFTNNQKFWRSIEGRLGTINATLKYILNKNDFNAYSTFLGVLDDPEMYLGFAGILEETVKDFDENDLKNISLGNQTKENFKFSPGQKLSLNILLKTISNVEAGTEPLLYKELFGKSAAPMILIEPSHEPSSSHLSTTQTTSTHTLTSDSSIQDRTATLITAENVETLLNRYISSKISSNISNLRILKRSTASYPFRLKTQCIFCDTFNCSISVTKEKKNNKFFTRFRADAFIKHIKDKHADLINIPPNVQD